MLCHQVDEFFCDTTHCDLVEKDAGVKEARLKVEDKCCRKVRRDETEERDHPDISTLIGRSFVCSWNGR